MKRAKAVTIPIDDLKTMPHDEQFITTFFTLNELMNGLDTAMEAMLNVIVNTNEDEEENQAVSYIYDVFTCSTMLTFAIMQQLLLERTKKGKKLIKGALDFMPTNHADSEEFREILVESIGYMFNAESKLFGTNKKKEELIKKVMAYLNGTSFVN